MEKLLIARKEYFCDYCQGAIAKGEQYLFMKGRTSKIENRRQTGIWFWQCRHCIECYKEAQEAKLRLQYQSEEELF